MYSSRSSSSLISVLIVLVVVAVLAIGVYTTCANQSGVNGDKARETARQYASELGINVKALTCARMDTDGDGYVSCTIMPTEGPPLMVECTGAWTLNEGCRAPKASIRLDY